MRSSVLILSLTLVFLNCPSYTNGQPWNWRTFLTVNAWKEYVKTCFFGKQIIKDIYEAVKFIGWKLLDFVVYRLISPVLDFIVNWLISPVLHFLGFHARYYTCLTLPDVKYVREKPHNEYIVVREKEIKELKELFDGFNNFDNKVNVVYELGVPGSGKTELARQFGKSVSCKQHGISTVLTLNTESAEEFMYSLVKSIIEIENSETTNEEVTPDPEKWNSYKKMEMSSLIYQLQYLLRKRPGWLLIVDNIRDPNITQKDLYKDLPTPGTDSWGTGKMLVTTQVPLADNSEHVRVKYTNDGLTLLDATTFLCGLVKKNRNPCDTEVAEKIVKKLELFPLSILAAGVFIDNSMTINNSYTFNDYLPEHAAVDMGILHEDSILLPTISKRHAYPHSMLTALLLTIQKTMDVHSDVFRDFIALIGFTAVNRGTISSTHVQKYLEMRGHNYKRSLLTLQFPLVDFWEEKGLFHVHQVVNYAFRKALERSETDDSLQYTLRNISYYFTNEYKSQPSKYEIIDHFTDLVHNLPTRYVHLNDCIIAPETEDLEAVSSLIFKAYSRETFPSTYYAFNCSKLEIFLFKLGHFSRYLNRVAVHIRFTGYQALYTCSTKLNNVNGSFSAATIAIELIKEIAPERSELHTVAVSWFLLRVHDFQWEKELYLHVSSFLLFPHYLKVSNNTDGIRRKLCSSLCNVTKILIPQYEKKVRTFCFPNLDDPTVKKIMSGLIPCYRGVANSLFIGVRPLMSKYHIGLGRSYRLGQYKAQKYYLRRNPYGVCDATRNFELSGFVRGKILTFYIDYDTRLGLKRVQIASRKYSAVFRFLKIVLQIMVNTNWKDYNMACQSIKHWAKTLQEKGPTFIARTELKMQSFQKDFLLFVDNYCSFLLHNLNLTTIFVMFNTWYMNVMDKGCMHHQDIEVLLDDLLHVTGLASEQTKDVTETLIEIIAATIYVSSNDNFQSGIELIPSNRV